MKHIKKVYFAVFVVLLTVMLVATFINILGVKPKTEFELDGAWEHIEELSQKPHSIFEPVEHEQNVQYIKDQLNKFGLYETGYVMNSENFDNSFMEPVFTQKDGVLAPQYGEIRTFLSEEEKKSIREEGHSKPFSREDEIGEITNIFAVFPSEKSKSGNYAESDVLVICAHYDSVINGPGASDDNHAIGAMLEAVRYLKAQNLSSQNDIVFLFTDAEEYGHQGAFSFLKFTGLENIAGRIKFVANFEARGTSGTSIMFETGQYNLNLITEYSKIDTTVYTSSIANFIYSVMPNGTDFSCFRRKGIQGLNFANTGSGENYRSSKNDNIANLKETHVVQHGDIMLKLVSHFKDFDLDSLYTHRNGVYFSYLSMFTVSYTLTAARVIAGLILALNIAIIVVGVIKKTFLPKAFFKGLIIQLLAMGGTFLGIWIFALIGGIFDKMFSAPWLLAIFAALALVIFKLICMLFIKLLKAQPQDVSAGSSFIVSLLAVVTTLIAHELSYVFALFAALELALRLIEKLISKPGLMLPAWAVVLTIPLFFSIYIMLGEALGVATYQLATLMITLFAGFIIPYLRLPSKKRA